MIKYLGSKRTLIGVITDALGRCVHGHTRERSVIDLFSGTSRVGYALKREGWRVLANDHNAYAHTLATCYVQADHHDLINDAERLVDEFNALARQSTHQPGWFTDTYCVRSRFFHPRNGERIEAIRNEIARKGLEPELEAVMLSSLMQAADRVDSTVGVQMAYLKQWAARAHNDLELRVPDLLPQSPSGKSMAYRMDALEAVDHLEAEVAYLDPPYNQHSYLGNYHVWETLVRWDAPEVYGVACKRVDCRARRSVFNSRAGCRDAIKQIIERIRARVLVVSFNDEGYVTRDELEAMLASRGPVTVLANDYQRYVGARIGIYNPSGEKVGTVGRLRNTEYLFIAGVELDGAALANASAAA